VSRANSKDKTIYIPDKWYEVMASAHHKKKFTVCQIQVKDFNKTLPFEKCFSQWKKLSLVVQQIG
jgi:hypothetical protein